MTNVIKSHGGVGILPRGVSHFVPFAFGELGAQSQVTRSAAYTAAISSLVVIAPKVHGTKWPIPLKQNIPNSLRGANSG
jgi:hypothetical protein